MFKLFMIPPLKINFYVELKDSVFILISFSYHQLVWNKKVNLLSLSQKIIVYFKNEI